MALKQEYGLIILLMVMDARSVAMVTDAMKIVIQNIADQIAPIAVDADGSKKKISNHKTLKTNQ